MVYSLLPIDGADIAALEPCGPVLVTGTGLPSIWEAKIDRASLPLQFQLSVSRAPQSQLCFSNVPDKAIRAPVAGLTLHLWNYGNSSFTQLKNTE